jgi:hypothetical protein
MLSGTRRVTHPFTMAGCLPSSCHHGVQRDRCHSLGGLLVRGGAARMWLVEPIACIHPPCRSCRLLPAMTNACTSQMRVHLCAGVHLQLRPRLGCACTVRPSIIASSRYELCAPANDPCLLLLEILPAADPCVAGAGADAASSQRCSTKCRACTRHRCNRACQAKVTILQSRHLRAGQAGVRGFGSRQADRRRWGACRFGRVCACVGAFDVRW